MNVPVLPANVLAALPLAVSPVPMTGEVRVLFVSVCVPPTVTAEAAFVPAVVTRRSPVLTVKMPLLCVITALPLATLMTAPVARCRSLKPSEVVPSAAASLVVGWSTASKLCALPLKVFAPVEVMKVPVLAAKVLAALPLAVSPVEITGETKVFEAKLCAPLLVTTDPAAVPAVVMIRLPVPSVSTPAECVTCTSPLAQLRTPPEARNRSLNPSVPVPSAAASLVVGWSTASKLCALPLKVLMPVLVMNVPVLPANVFAALPLAVSPVVITGEVQIFETRM